MKHMSSPRIAIYFHIPESVSLLNERVIIGMSSNGGVEWNIQFLVDG